MKTTFSFPLLLFFLFVLAPSATGQSQPVDRSFRFRDGFYQTAGQWRADSPAWPLDRVRAEWMDESNFEVICIRRMEVLEDDGWREAPVNELWGLSLGGRSYVRIGQEGKLVYFQRLFQPGRISFFAFEKPRRTEPLQFGRVLPAFADGMAQAGIEPVGGGLQGPGIFIYPSNARERLFNRNKKPDQWLLYAPTGELLPATPGNLAELLADDPGLTAAFARETAPETQVFRYVLQYNQRNPLYIR